MTFFIDLFHVEVFWVMTLCSFVVPLKRRYPTTTLHGVTTQMTLKYHGHERLKTRIKTTTLLPTLLLFFYVASYFER
jgi:hypothetical protein